MVFNRRALDLFQYIAVWSTPSTEVYTEAMDDRAPAGASAVRGAALRAKREEEHALRERQRKQAIASAHRRRPRAKLSRADADDDDDDESSCWHPISNGYCAVC